jgi:methionyl-tRNA formyltransferase
VKILFAGSPAIASRALEALAWLSLNDDRFQLVGVLTNPDTKRGRRDESEPTDVGVEAGRLEITTFSNTTGSKPLIDSIEEMARTIDIMVDVYNPIPSIFTTIIHTGSSITNSEMMANSSSIASRNINFVGPATNLTPNTGRVMSGSAATYTAPISRAPAVLRGVPLLKPEKLDEAARADIAVLKPDLLVSFAYGRIFGPKFLSLFPLGGINVHPSLLPKYRGATPIPAAILARDAETGVTIQRLALEMDAGDIIAQERFPLTGRETTRSLSEVAAVKGAELLIKVIRDLAMDKAVGRSQNDDEASYCGLIHSDDGLIDWSQSAADIDAKIRAYTPWPLCRTYHGKNIIYIIEGEPKAEAPAGTAPGTVLGIDRGLGILVQTGDGVLAVSRLQYAAKKALAWRDFLNGARDFIGSRLGGQEGNIT